MNNPSSSLMEKSISGFAHSAAALVSILLIPQIAKLLRHDIERYLAAEIGAEPALWLAWAFVVLAVLCCFFFVSGMMNIFMRLIIRRSARPRGL